MSESAAPRGPALGRIASWCYRRRRLVLISWILLLVVMTAIAQLVGTHFENKFSAGNTPSQRALTLLQSRFPGEAGDSAQVVIKTSVPFDSASNHRAVSQLSARLRALPDVESVVSPFSPGGAYQISRDGHIGYLTVNFTTTSDRIPGADVKKVIATAEALERPGVVVALGGAPISSVIAAAPGPSEGIGVTAAMAIMLIAFGSAVAMGLPILIALVGLATGIAVEELATHVLVIPTFSPELAAMMGLGVGIDYALLIVTRYRQCLGEGLEPEEAVVASLNTSGRAVLVAGATVVVSLLGLFLIGQPYMIGLSAGAIVSVLLVLVGLAHPLAGDARLRRPLHRAALDPALGRPVALGDGEGLLVSLEPDDPAPSVAGRDRRGRRARAFWRSRCSRCVSPSATRATTRRI